MPMPFLLEAALPHDEGEPSCILLDPAPPPPRRQCIFFRWTGSPSSVPPISSHPRLLRGRDRGTARHLVPTRVGGFAAGNARARLLPGVDDPGSYNKPRTASPAPRYRSNSDCTSGGVLRWM